MPVPFTVLCPTCRGRQYIYPSGAGHGNTDATHGLPCPTCNCKGFLQKGEKARTDKLYILYRRVTHPEMTCPFCKDFRHTRKKCRHCKSTRLRSDVVILHFKAGDQTLWQYLNQKHK